MFLESWIFKLTKNMVGKPIVQEQHTTPNHVPGIVDFHTHQEHGWETYYPRPTHDSQSCSWNSGFHAHQEHGWEHLVLTIPKP